MRFDLGEVQKLLYRLITAPNGVEEGLADEYDLAGLGLDAIIEGDDYVGAVDRVGIYADMYFYRILDALKEDFPATLKILGDVNFHNLITGYLVVYPPKQPSITEASRHLSAFAAASEWTSQFPHISDLIHLERALIDAFLGPDATPLNLAQLRSTPESEWPSLRLGLHPAVQLVACHWRVDELLRAVEESVAVGPAACDPTTIIVWRSDCVRYRTLDKLERNALDAICSGEEFMVACGRIAADWDDCK
jgi:hypothetical protein